jgi:excisionase family DNA binding protein
MDQPIRLQFEVVIPPEAVRSLREMLLNNDESEKRRLEASRRAIYGSAKPPEDESLLVDTQEAAKLLQCSARKIFKMQIAGEMPKPIRIGRAVRWGRAELIAWIDAGCPTAADWRIERKTQ